MHAALTWSNGEQFVKQVSSTAAAIRFKTIKRMPSTTSTTVPVRIASSRLTHIPCLLRGTPDGVLDGSEVAADDRLKPLLLPLPEPEPDVGAGVSKPPLLLVPEPDVGVDVRR